MDKTTKKLILLYFAYIPIFFVFVNLTTYCLGMLDRQIIIFLREPFSGIAGALVVGVFFAALWFIFMFPLLFINKAKV